MRDTYRIEVRHLFEKTVDDYGGGYTEEDVKCITKGFKEDVELGFDVTRIFTRKNGVKMFIVTAE